MSLNVDDILNLISYEAVCYITMKDWLGWDGVHCAMRSTSFVYRPWHLLLVLGVE